MLHRLGMFLLRLHDLDLATIGRIMPKEMNVKADGSEAFVKIWEAIAKGLASRRLLRRNNPKTFVTHVLRATPETWQGAVLDDIGEGGLKAARNYDIVVSAGTAANSACPRS
jgi:hypothetical protein